MYCSRTGRPSSEQEGKIFLRTGRKNLLRLCTCAVTVHLYAHQSFFPMPRSSNDKFDMISHIWSEIFDNTVPVSVQVFLNCTYTCEIVVCIHVGFGWLVDFGLNDPLRQYFSLYRVVSQREGERGEKG